jgi:hypothetical protein
MKTPTKKVQPGDGPVVSRAGIFDLQVCVPAEWTDAQALAFAEASSPCGTSHGWQQRKAGSDLLRGDPERRKCEERAGYVHIMFDA